MYSKNVEDVFKSKNIKTGDIIKVKAAVGSFEGMLMPRSELGDGDIIVLKLDNGYNIGIRFGDGASIEKIRDGPMLAAVSMPSGSSHNPNLPKVALIYTGGTIGSKIDYATGGVYMLTKPEELMAEVPELDGIANIEIRHLMSMASEDMGSAEWKAIAAEVFKAASEGARGIVVTIGTDTMHYASAALSFMLKDLRIPVILTGAQRSSDRGSSDAFTNLICAVQLAAKSEIGEVGICMHANSSDNYCSFIRGTKARKMHTSSRDAFRPINSKPLARVYPEGNIEYYSQYRKAAGVGDAKPILGFEDKVALIKTHPNLDPNVLDYYVNEGYKGIILEGTGLGHVPTFTSDPKRSWLEHVKNAISKGVVVGMTSQCIYGRVNTNVYRTLRLLSAAGVVYCEDMTPETAYVKLGFLLANYPGKAGEMLNKNMVGEISEKTEIDWLV
ncbi:MAG: Glu-tRNA(Gln) amidotransferase subunit GatD [Candidatus Micrarchaeia archaeon]